MQPQESDVLEQEVRIAARPETVFPFFTDPEKMTRWQGDSATLDPRPGGLYRVDMNGRDVARGQYVEVTPNSRVVFTWGWEGDKSPLPPGASTVEVTLTPDGDGTIVRLRHMGLPADQRDQHAEGWDHYLARLAIAGAGGDPGPDSAAAHADESGGLASQYRAYGSDQGANERKEEDHAQSCGPLGDPYQGGGEVPGVPGQALRMAHRQEQPDGLRLRRHPCRGRHQRRYIADRRAEPGA